MGDAPSRAVRNNNPGNLRPGDKVLWEGQTGVDPDGFAIFKDRESGLKAAEQQVLHDYNNHGLKTPRQLASKYTKTDQGPYMQRLASALGIGVDDDAKLTDPARFAAYMGQIYGNEDGGRPFDPDAEFAKIAKGEPDYNNEFAKISNMNDAAVQAAKGDALDQALGKPVESSPLPASVLAQVNKIHDAGGDAAKIADYLGGLGYKADPSSIDAAIAYKQAHGGPLLGVTHVADETPPTTGETLAAGFKQGMQDVGTAATKLEAAIPGAQWLEDKTGGPKLDQERAAQDAAEQLYNERYGNSLMGSVGRVGGNMLLTAPFMGGGGALAERGAAALNAAKPSTEALTTFLAGRAGGNALTRGASLATNGALQGAAMAPMVNIDPVTGATSGAIVGPIGGALGRAGTALANKLSPDINPIVRNLAVKANDVGINLRGSQISNSPTVRTLDSVLARIPGSGIAADNAAQREAFTRAITNTFGEDSPVITEQLMLDAKHRIGGTMGEIAGRTKITDASQLMDDLGEIESLAKQTLESSQPIKHQIDNILDKIDENGHMSGDDYKELIRHNGPLDTLLSDQDGTKRRIASDIKDALDDAFQSHATPADSAAWRNARMQYKNMMTIKGLVPKAVDGTIPPALLNNVVSTSFKDRAFSGAGDLGDLGKIGQRFLKIEGSSNTAERNDLINALTSAGKAGLGGGAALMGYNSGIPLGEAVLLGTAMPAATTAAGKVVANFLKSPKYRNRLLQLSIDDGADTGSAVNRLMLPAIDAVDRYRLAGAVVQ